MAQVDVNLLATPAFVMKNDANGQVITLGLGAITETTGTPVTLVTQKGWADIVINNSIVDSNSPLSISPMVTDDMYLAGANGSANITGEKAAKYRFFSFLSHNPVHITKMNIRATDQSTIPSQIMILTPNIFTGVMERQIVDVASRKNAYQYQNDIITLEDLDFYLGRDSIIRFVSSFSRVNWQTGDAGSAAEYFVKSSAPLYIDITIDRYISLEKGLYENVRLLTTATGQVSAITQEVAKVEANTNPTLVLNTQNANPNFNAQTIAQTVYPSIPQFQSKRRTR